MNTHQLFLSAFRSLNKHKMRSFLTTLGIIVGVIAIISVMSIGEGAKFAVKKEISKLGTNFIIVLGGSPKKLTATRGGTGNLTIKQKELDAIIAECDDVLMACPMAHKYLKSVYDGKNWQSIVAGTNELYSEIRKWDLVAGSFFTKQDLKAYKKVAVIGLTVRDELFGTTDPIGKTIRIKKIPFRVIGVLDEQGKTPDGRDQDDMILMPITTFQKKVAGIKNNAFSAIMLSTKSKDRMTHAANEIRAILRQQHKLKPKDDDDFTIFTQDDISQASDAASAVLNILLLIIASISLLVGGIGIMNIMLVTVTERTKEIGIRMAIGATTNAILIQFIIEAIVICLMGGLIGITIGFSISKIVGYCLGWPTFISTNSVLISLSSSILIGLFFGYYPARKASRLNPVDALIDNG